MRGAFLAAPLIGLVDTLGRSFAIASCGGPLTGPHRRASHRVDADLCADGAGPFVRLGAEAADELDACCFQCPVLTAEATAWAHCPRPFSSYRVPFAAGFGPKSYGARPFYARDGLCNCCVVSRFHFLVATAGWSRSDMQPSSDFWCLRGRNFGRTRYFGDALPPRFLASAILLRDRKRVSAHQECLFHHDHAGLRPDGILYCWVTCAVSWADDGLTVRLRSTLFGSRSFRMIAHSTISPFSLRSPPICCCRAYCLFALRGRGARENPTPMAALGFDVFRFQRVGYVIAGAVGGLSGFLLADALSSSARPICRGSYSVS